MNFTPLTSAINDNDIQCVRTFMSITRHNAKRTNTDHGAALLPYLIEAAAARRLEIIHLMLPLCTPQAQEQWPEHTPQDEDGVDFIHWWLNAQPEAKMDFSSMHAQWQSQRLQENVDVHIINLAPSKPASKI